NSQSTGFTELDINPPPVPRKKRAIAPTQVVPEPVQTPSASDQVPELPSVPTLPTFAFVHRKRLFSREESLAFQRLQKEHFELKLQCQGIRRSRALLKKRTHETLKKKLAKAYVPKKIRVIRLPPPITLPNTMATTQQNPQGEPQASPLRENWRDLTPEQRNQVSSKKDKGVRMPSQFKGTSSSDWLGFLDDLEDVFIQLGITYDEVKIYQTIVCMSYNLREEVAALDSSRGHSWDDFVRDLKDGWAFDDQQGSEEALRRMIDEYRIMPLNVTEVRFKTFVRKFRLESKKLEKPPALLSNKTLVEHFLSALEDKFVEKIIDGLNQSKRLRMELERAEGVDEERRKQDPWTLEQVINQAEMIMQTNLGLAYSVSNSSSSRQVRTEVTGTSVVPIPKEVRQGILKTGSSTAQVKSEPDFEQHLASAVDKQEVQLREIREGLHKQQEGWKKYQESFDKKFLESFVELKKLVLTASPSDERSRGSSGGSSQSSQPQMKTGTPMIGNGARSFTQGKCYMCGGPGHTSNECQYQKDFLQKGWLRFDPGKGKYVCYDGSSLPFVEEGDKEVRWQKITRFAQERGWPGVNDGEDPTAALYATALEPVTSFMMAEEASNPNGLAEAHSRLDEIQEALEALLSASARERSSTTPEVPQVVIPAPPAYVRADRKAAREARENKEKPKKNIYVPPQKRTDERVVRFNTNPDERDELEDESSEDESLPDIPTEVWRDGPAQYKKSPPATSRPFDKVKSIERPTIPKEQAVSESNVVGPPRDITQTIMKGPRVHTSVKKDEPKSQMDELDEVPPSQVEEELATCLLREGVHVHTQDLLAVSPALRKIVLRKIKN
ncbi:hypothetical protein V5O48_018269, partial [Marasmius crinis-equi]